ncbi:hypothetical protein RFI_31421 [Reticulomyxa filosa]|uniref:Uncharacterized protein n=1 Tax=Reticulomyxa filosa TaxID=46433 RepID=X6LZ20_RETFI|nr:hypothetical protein RFI_31421 [Reticulomyxa filosa]|eukprot:ETO05975.1 hypothetical protein RFI_31421 [Reticulomyxa filosa]
MYFGFQSRRLQRQYVFFCESNNNDNNTNNNDDDNDNDSDLPANELPLSQYETEDENNSSSAFHFTEVHIVFMLFLPSLITTNVLMWNLGPEQPIFEKRVQELPIEYVYAMGPEYIDLESSVFSMSVNMSRKGDAFTEEKPSEFVSMAESLGHKNSDLSDSPIESMLIYHKAWIEHQSTAISLHRSPWLQFLYCTLFCICSMCTLELCQWYVSQYFNNHDIFHTNPWLQFTLFLVFFLSFVLIKSVLKSVGFLIDMGKTRGSFFYCQGEMMGLLYYYVFYRVLLTAVNSVYVFIALQCIHLTMEWLMYAFRCSNLYVSFLNRMLSSFTSPSSLLSKAKPDDSLVGRFLSFAEVAQRIFFKAYTKSLQRSNSRNTILHQNAYNNWVSFLCLDFGIRLIVMSYTFFGFVICFFVVRFGYNRHIFLYFGDITLHHIRRSMLILFISFVLETFNAILMQRFWWKNHLQKAVLARCHYLLQNQFFRLFFIVALAVFPGKLFVAEVGISNGFKSSCNIL